MRRVGTCLLRPGHRPAREITRSLGACGLLALASWSCSTQASSNPATTEIGSVEVAVLEHREVDLVIDVDGRGTTVDPRLFGTNLPAWLGPERLRSDWLRSALRESGATSIRMPGGSWSNEYGWAACELRSATGCISGDAARPADFADVLADVGIAGVWTVSINESAQSAAAAVAYFNGRSTDSTPIGIDRNGVDWGTVGTWATRRAESGHADPVPIATWEIGNEVYGGRSDTGGEGCASFGWESVWTCNGATYVEGDDVHDGYRAIREAMLAVDRTILIGAVGVSDPTSWSDWGTEVIKRTMGSLDAYVVHGYGYDASPDPREAVLGARAFWSALVQATTASLPDGVPIALTEYNLVAVESGDTGRSMTKVVNGLWVADTIGSLATLGVPIANQWNLANGPTSSGTDYGMIDADGAGRYPQFDGFAAWQAAGTELLPIRVADGVDAEVRAYASRRADGSVHLIVVHPGTESRRLTVAATGAAALTSATVLSRSAASPNATAFEVDDPITASAEDGIITLELGPWSLSEIDLVHA